MKWISLIWAFLRFRKKPQTIFAVVASWILKNLQDAKYTKVCYKNVELWLDMIREVLDRVTKAVKTATVTSDGINEIVTLSKDGLMELGIINRYARELPAKDLKTQQVGIEVAKAAEFKANK